MKTRLALISLASALLTSCATVEPAPKEMLAAPAPVAPPGYEVRPAIISESHPRPYDIVETRETQEKREAAEQQKRREAYVAKDATLSPDIRSAILEGRLVVGMDPFEAQAAIGEIHRVSESDGVGGDVVVYYVNPGYETTMLYFVGSRLVRWSKTPNT